MKYVALADAPSPKDHANARSSLPTSLAVASNVISCPTRYGRTSSSVHVHVEGCCTLNVWWRRTSDPSGIVRMTQTGFAPFGCPFTGSSSGVYVSTIPTAANREIRVMPIDARWSSGEPGYRTTVAVPMRTPSTHTSIRTSCHFSPATRRVMSVAA